MDYYSARTTYPLPDIHLPSTILFPAIWEDHKWVKLAERKRKYNPKTGLTIEDYHNLWPIPYSEIERNVYATIEQNPGY
ncbi:RagB/SusD family nutrient uptake outer membrane protein [Parabacteroides merdae]|uniref:RagB/SusD family nutrient uptake outer membrane protein n=1 Tax=Parabacteroides merdae TaxID=46503 RepID=UPI00216AC912|nr:RagB/SusD family nutrient uptake outer membrane protein [Parabacteroides merdae]